MMNAMPNTAPINPRALPRFSGGKVSPITALATGKMPPAPNPWIARPASSTAKAGEMRHQQRPSREERHVQYVDRAPAEEVGQLGHQRRADQVEQHVDA